MMNYRKYEAEYSTLNNCDVTYVCTTDLGADNMLWLTYITNPFRTRFMAINTLVCFAT